MGFKRYYRGKDYDEVVYDPCRRRIRCILNAAKDNFLVIIALVVFFVAAIIGTVFWIVLKENVPYRWWCVFVPYIIAVIAFVFYAILYFRYKADDGVFGKPFFTVSLVLFALLCWLSILYTCIVNNPEVDVYENGLYYSIQEDDTLQVIRNGYNSYQMNELKIPEEVNGRKVTSIGKEAFSYSYSLTSIMIPNCITSIGYDAFIGCHALTIYCESANKPDGWHRDFYVCSYGLHCPVIWNCKINDKDKDGYAYTVVDGIRYKIKDNVATVARQPENITNANLKSSITYKEVSYSVTSIGGYAFSECSKLRSITIPNSVTSIGDSAFSGCSLLTNITIPASVTEIYANTFTACSKLENITVDESNIAYSSQDGILYNNKKTELICVPNGIKGSLSIPNSVTSIGDSAFSGCSLLTNITIPASVTEIYANTFTACSKLENITVDESNTAYSSQDGILYNKAKTQLIRVPLAKSSIIIFASVISINDDAFSGCAKLENINVDENNTEYASQGGLLYNKSKTQLIEVPKAVQGSVVICGVSSIGERAFSGCSSITSVEIPNSVTSIGNNAFENCSKLVTITIPNSVERIDRYAFKNCSSLTSIVLPDSVTCINAGAFWDCTNLKEVTFGSGVKSIEWMIFAGCKKINTIRYNGTIADWANIIKHNDWNYDNRIKTVICTDGVIDLTKALN